MTLVNLIYYFHSGILITVTELNVISQEIPQLSKLSIIPSPTLFICGTVTSNFTWYFILDRDFT